AATGVHQRANLHGELFKLRDLKHADLARPERRGLEDAAQFIAQGLHRDTVIGVDVAMREQVGALIGPVLERMVKEIRKRQYQPAEIPAAQDDVHRSDLFNPTPLALNDYGVFNAEGLREGDLHAGDQVGEGSFCRQAYDQAGESGGRQYALADVPDSRKGHQHNGQCDDDDQHDDDAVQHFELRLDAARGQVV